jgi:hypothetical protein
MAAPPFRSIGSEQILLDAGRREDRVARRFEHRAQHPQSLQGSRQFGSPHPALSSTWRIRGNHLQYIKYLRFFFNLQRLVQRGA